MPDEIKDVVVDEEIVNTEATESENVDPIEDLPMRQNPFCVISVKKFGEYGIRDIQTNSSWGKNPYGEEYAVVPDEMVPEIMETRGFCEITVEEGIVTGFTPTEIPEIPEPVPEPSMADRLAVVEEQLIATDEVAVALYEQQVAMEETNIAQDEAIVALYEMMEG